MSAFVAGSAPQRSHLWAASPIYWLPVAALSVYVLFLALVLHPTFQAHNVFLHAINYPFSASLRAPWTVKGMPRQDEKRVRNFRTKTSDGIDIAGWHIAPPRHNGQRGGENLDELMDYDLLTKPVLLFFHGNALNRGAPIRVRAYDSFLRHGLNVVAIDYRGFGDSSGVPSEAGLGRDARAAFRWVLERRRKAVAAWRSDLHSEEPRTSVAPRLLIAGQSLGTGVAARLTLELVDAGLPPAGVLLIAPYTSIRSLLTSYRIGGFLPIFWPLSLSAGLASIADKYLYTRFESDKALYIAARGGRARLLRDCEDDGAEEKDRVLRSAEELGHLDFVLSVPALRDELGLCEADVVASATDDSQKGAPYIVISHADNDRVIPNAHGRDLFNTVRRAYKATNDSNRTHEKDKHKSSCCSGKASAATPLRDSAAPDAAPDADVEVRTRGWGTLHIATRRSLAAQPAAVDAPRQRAPLALVKSYTGGHNGVPSHAVAFFVEQALQRSDSDG